MITLKCAFKIKLAKPSILLK